MEDVELRRRPIDMPIVIGVLALGLGAIFVWLNQGRPDAPIVEDETVLSENPLVVQGASAPTPEFDPSELGEEYPLTPNLSVEEGLELARRLKSEEIVRVKLIGRTPKGSMALITHYEKLHADQGLDTDELRVDTKRRPLWRSLRRKYG